MKIYPFHFSFLVRDLPSTREFYTRILGCKEGRSTDTWVDFDFFGSQLSAHIIDEVPQPIECGHVDNTIVPIPHFGCILDWDLFNSVAEKIEKAEIPFIIKPMIRYEGKPGEQATMFLKDFSGNAIEFKSFKNPDEIFTT